MRIGDRGQQRTAANSGSQIHPNWKWLGPVGKATGESRNNIFSSLISHDGLSECGLRPRTAFAAIYGFSRVRDASVESANWELHSTTCTQHVIDLASRFISRATQPAFRRSRRDQVPARGKNWTRGAAEINIIVQVVQRCSPGAGIKKHKIRVPLDRPEESERLVRREICAETGFLASRFSASRIRELFLKGTEPKEDSTNWFATDGKLLLPAEYAGWCASSNNTRGAHARPNPGITNPVANARYQIDPVLPRSQQMIELSATLGDRVQWFVNGTQIAPQSDGRFFWQIAPGQWNIRAVAQAEALKKRFLSSNAHLWAR
jgi:Penicillin-Binding Protein C-terminus Family